MYVMYRCDVDCPAVSEGGDMLLLAGIGKCMQASVPQGAMMMLQWEARVIPKIFNPSWRNSLYICLLPLVPKIRSSCPIDSSGCHFRNGYTISFCSFLECALLYSTQFYLHAHINLAAANHTEIVIAFWPLHTEIHSIFLPEHLWDLNMMQWHVQWWLTGFVSNPWSSMQS